MKITKDTRLSFSIDSDKYGTILVHSLPIGRDTFELYFAELAAVFHACYANDDEARHLALVGPRIAFAALKSAALARGTWKTPSGVEAGLINELVRLTQIAYVPEGGQGWQTLPMATATSREILGEEDVEEVLNSLVFFTAACKAGPRKLVSAMMPVIGESIGWEFSFSTLTAFIDSLERSTQDEPSTAIPSSIIA
jgi:hypothetical protein